MSDVKKPKKYLQAFKASYTSEFSFIVKSRVSDHHALCTLCGGDFSVAHAGKGDIIAHVNSQKHTKKAKIINEKSTISSFFSNSSDLNVIRAECLITNFLVEHNVSLSSADHVGPLLRKIFPNSDLAKKYGCARTKTTAIVECFSADSTNKLVENLKKVPFIISTDGSNDTDSNLYPIVVTYFDEISARVQSRILAVPVLKGNSTGENIANLILQTLERFAIPVSNCIGLVADNAPVMMGCKSGVFGILQQHQKDLINIGCSCHLLNLAAEKGASCLSLNVDELLIDIYYYLQKSSKRKEKLKVFQELHNSETKKILKHVCTRWLSLGRCLNRLLSQWDALVSFFKEEISDKNKNSSLRFYTIPKKKSNNPSASAEPNTSCAKFSNVKKRKADIAYLAEATKKSKKVKGSESSSTSVLTREERLFYLLTSDINKAFCLFLCYITPSFDKVNSVLQSDTPLIHKLRSILLDFFKQMLSKFVKPAIIGEASDILSVDYQNVDNQKLDGDLLIGSETTNVVNSLNSDDKVIFFQNVRDFYVKICHYMYHKFPFNKEALQHAEVCNISNFHRASFSDIKFFLTKFQVFSEACGCSMDDLESEFCELQITKIPEDIVNQEKADVQWVGISNLKNNLGSYPFKRISLVMLYILSIPHSNAECERIFSQVKKQRTEFRSSLSNETLENLLIMKCNFSGKCFEQEFDDKFLAKAKSCAYLKNK
jgi:hypothetical protein